MPRFDLSRLEAGIRIKERRREVSPKRVAAKISSMQFVPFRIGRLLGEGCARICESFESPSICGFKRHLCRGKYDSLTNVRKVGNDVLILEFYFDFGVAEEAGNLLHVPQCTSDGGVDMQVLELIPGIQSAVSIYCKGKQFIHVLSPV